MFMVLKPWDNENPMVIQDFAQNPIVNAQVMWDFAPIKTFIGFCWGHISTPAGVLKYYAKEKD